MKYNTEKIWSDFSASLRSFISKKISNQSNVDDLLQDVFTKIHMNIQCLEDDAKIKGWVYQITRNTIIDYYRKNHLQFEDILELPQGDQESIAVFDQTSFPDPFNQAAMGIKEMVEALPEKYAQALLLVEFEGKSQLELAEILNISVSGAKSRVQRGRKLLKESLLNCCHFELDRYGDIINYKPIDH